MPWSGGTYTRTDGVRTGTTVCAQQRTADLDLTDTVFDAMHNDLATAINNTDHPRRAELPHRQPAHERQESTPTWRTARPATTMPRMASFWTPPGVWVPGSSVGGTANAITLTPTTAITAYEANQLFTFPVKSDNTGAVTLAVSEPFAAVAFTMAGNQAFVGGELQATAIVQALYDGMRFQAINLWAGGNVNVYDGTVMRFWYGPDGSVPTQASRVQGIVYLGHQ